MSPNPNPQLTPLQLAVLRVLWERGEARVAEVREALAGARQLAQNTIATILSRLEKQGLVAHESEGRQFVYRALIEADEAEATMVGELTERVFEGDYAKLFSHLLARDEVDAGELAKVRALIDERLQEEGTLMFTQALVATLATYLLHSTLLLGAAWLVTHFVREARSREGLWRAALFGAVLTTLVQTQVAPRIQGSDDAASSAVVAFVEPTAEPVSSGASLFGLLAAPGGERTTARAIVEPLLGLSSWLVGAWALVATALFVRHSARRKRFLSSLGVRRVLLREERARAMRGLSAATSLKLSASVRLISPVVLSSEEICVPERALLEMPAASLASMLAHELAHVERRDTRWLVVYQVLEALFFFQPLVFVATRSLRADAELACDREAVARGADALSLADTLAKVAQWGAPPVGALGVLGETESALMTRVRALLECESSARKNGKAAALLLGTLALGLACAGPAVQAPEDPAEQASRSGVETVMRVELRSDVKLAVEGTEYDLPADWKRFERDLKLRAHVDLQPEAFPPNDSELQVVIHASPEVPFGQVLHVMGTCATARVWNIAIEQADGTLLPVPLPRDLHVIPEELEEEPLEPSEEHVVSDVFDPQRRSAKVVFSRKASEELAYRVDGREVEGAASLIEALRVQHELQPYVSITLDVRSGVLYPEVCALIDEILAAELDGAQLMFVGRYE